jgi:hypothetical protein
MIKRILILFLIFSFNLKAQGLEVKALKVDGRIFFVYEKDTTSEAYFFVDNYITTKQVRYSLMNNYVLANNILNLCGDVNNMITFGLDQLEQSNVLIESSLFRREVRFNSGKHFGGEIYSMVANKNRIAISFNVSVFGICIMSGCPAIAHPLLAETNHCDFIDDNRESIILLITNVVKTSPLSAEEVCSSTLIKSSLKQFSVIYCE